MVSRKNWLNSTGTCKAIDGEYFSYHQQMTEHYKGYVLFDNGFWSRTTRKHQSLIRNFIGYNTIDLVHANFNKGAEYSIKNEIDCLTSELETRLTKRKTSTNKMIINYIEKKIYTLKRILAE